MKKDIHKKGIKTDGGTRKIKGDHIGEEQPVNPKSNNQDTSCTFVVHVRRCDSTLLSLSRTICHNRVRDMKERLVYIFQKREQRRTEEIKRDRHRQDLYSRNTLREKMW